MGANANAGKKPSMLFPFGPEQPCTEQYWTADRTNNIHRTAITNAMYLRMRIHYCYHPVSGTDDWDDSTRCAKKTSKYPWITITECPVKRSSTRNDSKYAQAGMGFVVSDSCRDETAS